jgi:hypothetical protein
VSQVLSFQNPGLIDPRAYRLFGASAKEGKNPIGFFGTGLKYAIAVFLRAGCKIELHTGLNKVEFGVQDISMRGTEFKVVTATRWGRDEHGPDSYPVEELPFTTELGKTWKPWQAMRELWCNAIDEQGCMEPVELEPKAGCTTIVVRGVAAGEAWMDRETVMLTPGRPAALHNGVEVYHRPGRHLYFRGIRVHDLPYPSLFTYNIIGHALGLTEDRTLRDTWMAQQLVASAIGQMEDQRMLREFFEAPSTKFEYHLDVSGQDVSPVFDQMLRESVKKRIDRNRSLIALYKQLTGREQEYEEREPTPLERKMLERGLRVCRELGLKAELPVRVTDEMQEGVHAIADRATNVVWLSSRTFMVGSKYVAGTLVEEFIHHEKGLDDCTREMQNYLVDMVVSQYERVEGLPL